MSNAREHPAIDKVLLLMISGMSGNDLATACTTKLEVDPADVKTVLRAARRKLTRAAEFNRDEQMGTSITRLNDLYSRAIRAQDSKTALVAQKELNKLLGMYDGKDTDPDDPTEPAPEAGELAEVRRHLLPLNLAAPDTSTAELARLAVQRIVELMSETDCKV